MPDDIQNANYPPPSFLFEVSIEHMDTKDVCRFQEISGINAEIKFEEIREGGINTFSRKLPKNVIYPNLVLKRGLIKGSSLILNWVKATLEQFVFTPHNIIVKLLDKEGNPLVKWSFQNAYPVAMKIGDFKAMDDAYVIETLEFAYNSFEREVSAEN